VKKLSVQYTVREMIGWHSDDVAEPSQLYLHDNILHGLAICSMADLYMGNFVPPVQTEDPLQTTDVEGLKGFNVTSVQDPGFTTVMKDRYTDGIVDGNFGGWGQVPIEEDTLGEATRSSRSKFGAVLYITRYVTL